MDHISPVLWQFLEKWLEHFALFPPEASTVAPQSDALFFFMVLVSLIGLTIVVLLIVAFSILYSKKRHPQAVQIEGSTILEATWTIIPLGPLSGDVRLGRIALFPHLHAAGQRLEHLRGGQAMDVEGRASWRPARDQHAARARGPAHPDHAHLAGCLPQLFHSRIPRQARGHSGPLHHGVVRGHQDRHLSPLLHAVLRHQSLADDRRRDRDDARRLQEVARKLDERQLAGAGWRAALREPELRRLPQRAARRARPQPGQCLQRAS